MELLEKVITTLRMVDEAPREYSDKLGATCWAIMLTPKQLREIRETVVVAQQKLIGGQYG